MSGQTWDNSIRYQHVQKSPLFFLLIIFAGVMLAMMGFAQGQPDAITVLGTVSVLFLLLAFSFYKLTTTVDGERLSVRFGPIPLFGSSYALTDIEEASVDCTSIIDGWGIHYVPFRGWTINIWGFQCVKLRLKNGQVIRVGTNDADNLFHQIEAAQSAI